MHPLILQSGPARNILVLSHKSTKSRKKPKNLDASQSGMHGYLHQIQTPKGGAAASPPLPLLGSAGKALPQEHAVKNKALRQQSTGSREEERQDPWQDSVHVADAWTHGAPKQPRSSSTASG